MKFYNLLFLIMFSNLFNNAFSEEWSCPKAALSNKATVKAIEFLKSYEGHFKLGSCKIEMQICNTDEDATNEGSLAGDIIITDETGFQRYVPFFMIADKSSWAKQVSYLGNRAFVYRFKDKNRDTSTGSDENYDIEFIKKVKSDELDYIEIGFTSEVERDDKVNKHWIACGYEREQYLKEHPYKHKLKSKWWWITNPDNR